MSDWVLSLPFALATVLTLVHVTACVLALGVLPGNRKPSAAMAWLILILAVPYFGILAFLFFGSNTVGRKRRTEQREVNERVMTAARDLPAAELGDIERPETLRGFDQLSSTLGALPLSSGNRVEMLSDYRGVFAEMVAEVDRAESFVHVQFYISAWDEWTSDFFDALVRARARGVEVRFMFDHIGSRGIPGYKDFVKKLEATDLRLGADAADPPPQGADPAPRPAEPPQDHGRRRTGRLRGLAEPHRGRLRQAQEPRARPRVGGADDAPRGPGGPAAERRLRHRLVQRDR